MSTESTVPVAAAPGRVDFWIDTCRETTLMRIANKQVLDLYRKYGCCFYEPSHTQTEHVLKALDEALPQWDQLHPELFYQTLEMNFPELLRH